MCVEEAGWETKSSQARIITDSTKDREHMMINSVSKGWGKGGERSQREADFRPPND